MGTLLADSLAVGSLDSDLTGERLRSMLLTSGGMVTITAFGLFAVEHPLLKSIFLLFTGGLLNPPLLTRVFSRA